VLGVPGHRRPQGFGHGINAGLSAGGGAPFIVVGPQRQLARGEKVFQSPRQRPVGGDGFQQYLRMDRGIVDQVLTESGEHSARATGMMTADQVGGEVAQPFRWIIQCLGEIGGTDGDPVRRAAPTGPAPPGTGQSSDPPAVDTGRIRIRWPARMRTWPAPTGVGSQDPAFAAARALGSIGVTPLSSGTLRAKVAVDEQHRRVTDPAGARAANAVAGVLLQNPGDAAARARMLDRSV
jgi:hypothetical protein